MGQLSKWRIGERSLDIDGTGEIKYPGRTGKLPYDGLLKGNQDLGRSGNYNWEATLAKLTIGGDECNRYSYRCGRKGETTTLRSQSSNQSIMMNPSGTKFPRVKIVLQKDLRVGTVSESLRKKSIESQHGM